jgi:hypothetical protein
MADAMQQGLNRLTKLARAQGKATGRAAPTSADTDAILERARPEDLAAFESPDAFKRIEKGMAQGAGRKGGANVANKRSKSGSKRVKKSGSKPGRVRRAASAVAGAVGAVVNRVRGRKAPTARKGATGKRRKKSAGRTPASRQPGPGPMVMEQLGDGSFAVVQPAPSSRRKGKGKGKGGRFGKGGAMVAGVAQNVTGAELVIDAALALGAGAASVKLDQMIAARPLGFEPSSWSVLAELVVAFLARKKWRGRITRGALAMAFGTVTAKVAKATHLLGDGSAGPIAG